MSNTRRLLVLISLGVAACSQQPRATTGTLQGHLYRVGGPAPGSPVPLSGTITVTGNATSWEIKADVDGYYTVAVPPGRYTVTGHSPNINDSRQPCPAPNPGQISIGRTTTLDSYCSIP